MFAQVISGLAADRDGLRRQFERWVRELRPGAAGFLGSTGGVTAEGHFVAVVRFEDAAASRANAERPEQSAWWQDTEQLLDGPATFRESDDIELLGVGGSDSAGFVQVIEGRTADRATFMHLERQLEQGFLDHRPDFIGSTLVWWRNGTWLEAAYFTSEAEVRAGEARGLSPALDELFAQWQQLASPSLYLDLGKPWLAS